MTERELSRQAIADYYAAHADELRAFVAARTAGAAPADDIVQDVFLRLLLSDKLISTVTLPALAMQVARNLIIDHWRRTSTAQAYERLVAASADTEPQAVYSTDGIHELFERGMARLTPAQRGVYRMNIVDGMRVSEISKTLNINYKSVENRLGAARKEMRSYMRRMLA